MMGKWKLIVCGLLFSLFFGVTALAAGTYQITVVEDVQIENGTVKVTFNEDCYSGGQAEANKIVEANTPVDCKLEIFSAGVKGQTFTDDKVNGDVAGNMTLHAFKLKVASLEVNEKSYPFTEVRSKSGGDLNNFTIDRNSSITLKVPGFSVNSVLWGDERRQDEASSWEVYTHQYSASEDTFTLSFLPLDLVMGKTYGVTSNAGSQTQPAKPDPPAAFGLASNKATVDGKEVTVTMGDSSQSLTSENIAAAISADKTLSYKSYVKDITLSSNLTGNQSVELTFDVPEAKTTSKVKALHYSNTGNKWEEVPGATVTAQYKVKVTFTALSPVAILVYNAPASAPSGGGGQPSDNGSPDATAPASESAAAQTAQGAGQSPKTSDSNALQYAYAVAALSLLGFAVCRKKSMRK